MRVEELERELRAERPDAGSRVRPPARRVGGAGVPTRPWPRPARRGPPARRGGSGRRSRPRPRGGSWCRSAPWRRCWSWSESWSAKTRIRPAWPGAPGTGDQAATPSFSDRAGRPGEKTGAAGVCERRPRPIAPGRFPAPAPDADRIARGTDERIVDATARITLGAEADRVQEVANEVVAVTDRHDGVVLSSQVTTDAGGARAAFELEIPYKRLDAALTDLSGLADVISRTEAGQDITARAVRAQKDLAATYERIRRARIELIRADTTEERLVIESRISALEATADGRARRAQRRQAPGPVRDRERRRHLERLGLRPAAAGASARRSTMPAGCSR